MRPIIFLLIGLSIAFFFRDKFATFSRVTFPSLSADYWKLAPNRLWWIGFQGEHARVIWMNGEMFPPPPAPDPSMQNFAPQGVMR